MVLVHGGFVDGSGWQGVHERFVSAGYNVNLVQNPTSLAGDLPQAQFTADSQVPWGLKALNGAVSGPAWRTEPSGTWSPPTTA
ncbi:hypothetical protein ABZY10_34005 [Streptomyces sp. NPDC006539]|uniref:hypothetical protein n=1 Tax=Streptomyces sp. NPDC006539 TaxID=3155352 RepID=UPI0033A5817D